MDRLGFVWHGIRWWLKLSLVDRIDGLKALQICFDADDPMSAQLDLAGDYTVAKRERPAK